MQEADEGDAAWRKWLGGRRKGNIDGEMGFDLRYLGGVIRARRKREDT